MFVEFLKATLAIFVLSSFWMIVRSAASKSRCSAEGNDNASDTLGCLGCSSKCQSRSQE